MDSGTFSTTLGIFSKLATRMAWLGRRQQVLAQNIANADTPNYKPMDLKPLDFGAQALVLGGKRVGVTQHARDLVGKLFEFVQHRVSVRIEWRDFSRSYRPRLSSVWIAGCKRCAEGRAARNVFCRRIRVVEGVSVTLAPSWCPQSRSAVKREAGSARCLSAAPTCAAPATVSERH